MVCDRHVLRMNVPIHIHEFVRILHMLRQLIAAPFPKSGRLLVAQNQILAPTYYVLHKSRSPGIWFGRPMPLPVWTRRQIRELLIVSPLFSATVVHVHDMAVLSAELRLAVLLVQRQLLLLQLFYLILTVCLQLIENVMLK